MRIRTTTSLVAALALAACGGISTTTDWDPAFDFAGGNTYDWIDSQGQVDNITSSRIRVATNQALEQRGFSQDSSNPNLAVSYQITTDQRRSFNTVNTGWGGGYRWGGWGMGMSTSRTTENVWTEGTLILAIFDTGTRNMVWTGSATTDLDGSKSPEERQRLIQDAVDRMMRDFPPGG